MEILIELFLEFFGEILLEVVFGVFAEFLKATIPNPRSESEQLHPLAAVSLYAMLGSVAGVVSLWFVPGRMVKPGPLTGVSILLAPVVSGSLLVLLGRLTARRGITGYRLDRFAYGIALVLPIALLRFFFAKV